jgi:hypothetical protein
LPGYVAEAEGDAFKSIVLVRTETGYLRSRFLREQRWHSCE